MAAILSKLAANRCRSWNICPLGDISKYVGCRRPECPTRTVADVPSPMIRRDA